MQDPTRHSLLMRIAADNDADGWREFNAIYQPVLASFIRSRGIKDTATVDDIVQEVLLGLVRGMSMKNYDQERGRFRTLLWQAAGNAVISWYRKNGRHQQNLGLDVDSRIREIEAESLGDPSADFVRELRQRALEQALKRLEQELPPQRWQCLAMHVLNRMPATEVADELGISANLVYVHASRGMKRLREVCAEYMEDFSDE